MRHKLTHWVNSHLLGLFVFNLVIIILVLLHGAGYFHPFFIISINFITIVGLTLSIFLLGANSKTMFGMSLLFWFVASIFRNLNIDIWAERAAINVYQALVIGVLLLIIETVGINFKRVEVYLSLVKKFFLRSKQ